MLAYRNAKTLSDLRYNVQGVHATDGIKLYICVRVCLFEYMHSVTGP